MNQPTHTELATEPKLRQPLFRLMLTGFMGAGKSTVGALLADRLSWKFVDLDDAIERAGGMTVAEIFRDHGEASFRERERQAVRDLIEEHRIVVALGGGTLEEESTRSLILSSMGSCLIYLEAELSELLSRCEAQDKVRPLLTTPASLRARLDRRLPFYQSAHITTRTTGLDPQSVVEDVMQQIRASWEPKRADEKKKVVAHGIS